MTVHSENAKLEKILQELEELSQKFHDSAELNTRLEKISTALEKARIGDLIQNYNDPKRVFFMNFFVGLARGLGLTVGTAVVLAILGLLLKEFVSIPYIGQYISDIVEYVQLDQYYGE